MTTTPPQQYEHFFNGHNNARLTFVFGIVFGMTVMTLAGLGFFVYVVNGGELKHYELEPLDTSKNILSEPTHNIEQVDGIAVDDQTVILGAKENYAVTLVQYVDYECRFCKKFYPEVKQLVDEHGDKIRFIVKQYPLVQIHPQAKAAAQAATCAAQQDKFTDMSDQLFADQQNLNLEHYRTWAGELQLDLVQFEGCLNDPLITATLEQSATEAVSLGVISQPNLVIWYNDGKLELIDGYVSKEYLTSKLSSYF